LLRRRSALEIAVSILIVRGQVAQTWLSAFSHLREDVSMRETWDFSMPLEDAMTTQRAVRRLKPDPVDDALLLRLIELAVKAPSGSNAQNWEFIVVRDLDVNAKLARRNRQAWHLYGGLGRWLTRHDPTMSRVLNAVQWQADHFEEIPVIVVACLRGPGRRGSCGPGSGP
jgi:nitroreductase